MTARPEGEEELRATFERAAVGVAHVGLDGRWLRVNPWLCDLLGYSSDELLGLTFQDVTHPEDLDADSAHVRRLLDGAAETYAMEKRYLRKDRSHVWARLTVSLVRAPDGRPAYFVSVVEEVTARRAAEEALKQRNRQLDLLAFTAELLLLGSRSERETLAAIFLEMGRLLDTESCYHYRPGDDPRVLRLDLSHGTSEEARALFGTMRFGELLCGRVAESKARLIVEDLQRSDQPGSDVLRRSGGTSYAGFPLLVGGELWGTVAFVSERRRTFRDGDVATIQAACDQVAAWLDRMRLARDVRAGEERLRALLDTASEGIWQGDRDGQTLYVNEQLARLVERSPAEILGRPLAEIVDPRDRAVATDRVRQSLEGHRQRFDLRFALPDGSTAEVLAATNPIHDEDGAIVGALGMFADITARKRAEEQLRASEALLRAVLASTTDLIWVKDREGRITLGNQATFDALGGGDPEAVLGRRARELGEDPEHASAIDENDARVLATGRPETVEELFAHDGQDYVYQSVKAPLRDGEGAVVGVVGVSRDVTAARRTPQALRDSEDRLRDADQRKDDFLATLAHELRNPLAPIRHGLQLLQLVGGGPEAAERARAVMARQVDQMVRLIDDLMDVSRISRGKIALQRRTMDIAEAVRVAVDTSRPLLLAQDHTFVLELPPEPIHVDGEPARLAQVFANLLNNAAKYTDRGGRVRLTVERWEREVQVTVEDNGTGIPPDMLARVFDLFTQVDGSAERAQGGLGLGLNIVQRLVSMHGGVVTVTSAGPGRGSTFTVRLPRRDAGPDREGT